MLIAMIPFLGLLLVWVTGSLWVTDFAVPVRNGGALRRVLVIFPHADDEAVTCGGFLHRLARGGSVVTLVILTKGERGTPHATLDVGLGDIRVREAQAVAAILRIARCIQADFGDGTLHAKKPELTDFIEQMIAQDHPDLLITYDRAGFYGHSDHIICSEIISELRENRFPAVPLWYVTFPKRVLARVKLPEQLTMPASIQTKQALPTHKIFIGADVLPKIRAWYTYKSQRAALTTGIGRLLPIWFFLSIMLFEYFAEVQQ